MSGTTSSPKLLIFCPFYPPHIGGLESHADEFNYYLAKRGYQITVFTPQVPAGSLVSETRYPGVQVFRFPAIEIVPNYPLPVFWTPAFWHQITTLFNSDFDLVISRTRFFLTSVMALIYAKFKRKKWLHIEHGSDFVIVNSRFSTLVAKIYDLAIGKFIFRHSDITVSISKGVNKFVKYFDDRPSPIIYRGLNFAALDKISLNKAFRQKYRHKHIICFAGRLYKWKGVSNSLAALNELPESVNRQLVFVIIGGGEDLNRLRQQAGSNVVFLGETGWQETISYLKASDIYLHSSLSGGGLSTSLLEAMYCGCSIIATPGEGAAEIVNDSNGLLITNSTPETIKAAILKTLTTTLKSDHQQLQKRLISDKFSWGKNISKYHKLIQGLI